MNVSLDVNLLATLAILLPLAVAAFALQDRRRGYKRREHELYEAIVLLDIHADEMRKLDDERVPVSLLKLVVALSTVLHEPKFRGAVTTVMREGRVKSAETNPLAQQAADRVSGDYRALHEKHPDLAAAYIAALVSCILSFEKRHPDCAGNFEVGLPRMVSSPVQEAQRIVRAAGSRSDWDLGPPGAIPA